MPYILQLDKVKSVAYLRSFRGFEVGNEDGRRPVAGEILEYQIGES